MAFLTNVRFMLLPFRFNQTFRRVKIVFYYFRHFSQRWIAWITPRSSKFSIPGSQPGLNSIQSTTIITLISQTKYTSGLATVIFRLNDGDLESAVIMWSFCQCYGEWDSILLTLFYYLKNKYRLGHKRLPWFSLTNHRNGLRVIY